LKSENNLQNTSRSLAGETKVFETTEIIDCPELARRWSLPVSWIRDQVRARAKDPIPHLRFGKYVRFRWGSPELANWLAARTVISISPVRNRTVQR
jgi:hypothetical protein